MRWRSTGPVLGALSILVGGCDSCVSLEGYRLVPNDGIEPSGSTGGTTSDCAPVSKGTIFVSVMRGPTGTDVGGGEDLCTPVDPTMAGLDVIELDPQDGACLARTLIAKNVGAVLESAPRIRHSPANDARLHIAALYRGGPLELPFRCSDGASVTVEEAPGATDSLFIAELRPQGSPFCTEWVRRAWTTDSGAAGALHINAVEESDEGDVVMVGTLGGVLTQFEDGASSGGVLGKAFFARYRSDGTLVEATALPGLPGAADAAMGAAMLSGKWLVAGTVKSEGPACYGCTGKTHVVDAAGVCPPLDGGAGGAGGGAGGSGAGGGAGGAGEGGGAAAPDTQNAFVWQRSGLGDSCSILTTFGSDRLGNGDAQIGYGVSPTPLECGGYIAGLAGRDPWRFVAADPATALFDTGGQSSDGFIARFDGGDALGCGASSGPMWSVRITPSQAAAVVFGDRVAAGRCNKQVVATAFVRDAAFVDVDIHRCELEGCKKIAADLALAADADRQLMVVGLRDNGDMDWHTAIGPVSADEGAGAGTFAGRPHGDLALDDRDSPYIVFKTTGPLRVGNVEPASCDELKEGAPTGTYAMGMKSGGWFGAGRCQWLRRLGP